MLQELGHMSRRGHKTGTITTYNHTWLPKTDGWGCVWISDAIPYHTEGSDSRASVTEVRHCQFPASIRTGIQHRILHSLGLVSHQWSWVCHAGMRSSCPALVPDVPAPSAGSPI